MRQITFSEVDVQAIARERYHHPDPRVQRHMEILWLSHHRFTHSAIATLAACSPSTVARTLSAYLQGGLELLRQVPLRQSHGELDGHRASREAFFTRHPPRSVKQARHVIEEHTGIRRGLTQVRHFLHRLGLQPRKVAARAVRLFKMREAEKVKRQGEAVVELADGSRQAGRDLLG